MLDLKPTDEAAILALLKRYVPDADVWAFGSRVTGRAHAASDLDLVIRNPPNLSVPQERLTTLRGALAESDVTILVDVVDWSTIPESFRREIEQAHRVMRQPGAAA
jgi:predicted nucleotidyltransferase